MPAEEDVSEKIVVVVAGGEAPRAESALQVPDGAEVIAADGGLDHARALGLDVSVAVGDFDSVSEQALADAEAAGVRLVRHPAEKDATDLELALDLAVSSGAYRILALAGDRGRLDHLLAGLLLLGSGKYAGVEVDALVGRARVHVVRGRRTLTGETGELVSLLALHGAASGATTAGLAYELRGETLEPGSSRGVSNVLTAPEATVSVERGTLLALFPGAEEGT
jgi:thiamine pyrophosphokinase